MSSIWDNPEMKVGGDYVKFEEIGDTVTGTVLDIRIHRWTDGTTSPQLLLDIDGEEKTVTAGQVRLKAALAEKRPEQGDQITITLADVEKRPGGKTLKIFDVKVVRGSGAPAPAPAASEGSSLGLTDEQKATLTPDQIAALAALGK